jgi:hypothetical protein
MRLIERKQDTRKKIQLGGLIIKAGLMDEPTAILLGLLLEANETLQSEEAETARRRWKVLGDIAFTRDELDLADD